MIDCHVHLAAFQTEENGCYLSPRMLKSPLFRFLIWKHGLSADDPLRSNRKFVDDLLTELQRSKYVEKAILLAMDGVYDANGRLDLGETDFLIANDYVLDVARSYPNSFWPGVSINPQRRDAVEELERCVSAGAKLVKVLPNAQGFDPGDRRYLPIYRKLAQLHMPLLSHVGYEFSLIGKDQSAGDPSRLRVPLEEGVMVIAAHGCSNGLVFSEPYYQTFLAMVRGYKNCFSDVSALTLPNRFGMLLRLRRHPELHDRLLFGTDYPLAVFHPPTKTFRADNRFDRQHLVLKWLGIGFRSIEDILAM